jgi:GAF domain-containing protein/HAMP domain-containing protein
MSTITPSLAQPPTSNENARRARNALIAAALVFVVTALILALSLYEDLQSGSQPFSRNDRLLALLAASALVGVGLSRTRYSPWGVFQLSVVVVAVVAGLVTAIQTIGLLGGLATIGAIAAMSTLAVPPRWTPRLLVFGVASGVAIILLDLYWPGQRSGAGAMLSSLLPFIVMALVAVMILLVYWQFRTYGLRTKLTLLLLGVSLLPVALLAYLNSDFTNRTLSRATDQALSAAASQTTLVLENFIRGKLDEIRIEAQLEDLRALLEEGPSGEAQARVEEIFQVLLRKDPINLSSYALLDRSGVDVLDTFADDIGLDKSDRDYFQGAVQTGLPYISPVQTSATTGEASFYVSAPVRNRAGDIIGVLRARYSAALFQQIIRTNTGLAGEGSFATLVDERFIRLADGSDPNTVGTVIGALGREELAELKAQRRLPDQPDETLFLDLPEFAAALAGLDTQPIFDAEVHAAEGVSHSERSAAARLSLQPWVVVYSLPRESFATPLEAQNRQNILITLALAGVVVFASIWVTQVLAAPIVRLTATAAQISAGDLHAQAPVDSTDEIGALATTFNVMTTQLRETLEGLEQRVADRTRALAASAEVSRRLSTIINRQQLVREVVEQVQSAFNYYHAHVYLFDDAHEKLVMMGGTGEVGRTLLANGHFIPRGRGLVGRAAETNAAVLVSNTTADPNWLPNPLLPETRSEVAVPIALGDQVLGVLDVQHNVVNGLTRDDADLLQSIANQIAVALQNARSYQRAQEEAEREALLNLITQRVQSATTVEGALQVAVRELGQALGSRRASVKLKGPNGGDHPETARS